MGTVVLSISYLPPVEYFVCLKRADNILIETAENYNRQTYRNRCVIAGPNGLQVLTVPVIHKKYEKVNIREVRIDYSTRWQQVHWRSLEAAYNKSPYFSFYRDEFEPFYFSRHQFLYDLNIDLLNLCMRLAGIKTQIAATATYNKDYPNAFDMRMKISPKNHRMNFIFPRYPQVFEPATGYIPNLSIIDLILNRGPETSPFLDTVKDL